MFKIALGAGHRLDTSGKRCLKSLDPNETREWWLNDRICDHVESLLKDYDGYELLRIDDTEGQKAMDLATRVKKANDWGADFALAVHHNAGIKGGTGGGIVAYVCNGVGAETKAWQKELYDALIEHTGLKGNRATPLAVSNLYVLVHTKMPAVLLELGFMDSATDVPIILTDEYAQQCARAIVEVLVKRGGLTKKTTQGVALYRVQLGAFSKEANAEKLKAEVLAKGYQAYVTQRGDLYRVQVGAFKNKSNAEKLKTELAAKGYQVYMVRV